jgi:hypothetical protein
MACHWAARWGTRELLQKIWELVKNKLTTEEISIKYYLTQTMLE